MEDSVSLAALGIVSGVVVSMFALINYLLKRSDKTIQANTASGVSQAKAGNSQAIATLELSKAVSQLNTSIVERDAQDREFHKQVMAQFQLMGEKTDLVLERTDRNYKAVQNIIIKNQTVENQTVKHEIVEVKEDKDGKS